jgi:hypothetical protein
LCLFFSFEFRESRFPSLLQFCCYQTIVGIHPIELPLGESRFIAEAFQMLPTRMLNLLKCRLPAICFQVDYAA